MSEDEQLGHTAHAAFVLLDGTVQRMIREGADQRAVVIALTAYLGRFLARAAVPGMLGDLIKGTQESIAEQAMREGETLGNG